MKTAFKLKSGNSPLFKTVGSSPLKHDPEFKRTKRHEHPHFKKVKDKKGIWRKYKEIVKEGVKGAGDIIWGRDNPLRPRK